MNKTVHPELFKGTDLKSDPIQIPIKPCCNLAVMSGFVRFLTLTFLSNPVVVSCLVTFSALAPEPSIGGASRSLYSTVPLALTATRRYSSYALSKISKLALVGYEYTAHTVRFMGFFCMRYFPMRSHIFMAKLWGDAFERASYLYYLSTNPLQLCHPNYLVVIGKAPLFNTGAHTHA